MDSLGKNLHVAVLGASGGIGAALVAELARDVDVEAVHAFSRTPVSDPLPKVHPGFVDLEDEDSIKAAASTCGNQGRLSLVIVATGVLHRADTLQPEKSFRALDPAQMRLAFATNAIGPALVAKHFLPQLTKGPRSVFAVLSARVGSISDNRYGGWYAYRASKAALNMLIKTLAVELRFRNRSALCLALHPGTVDTGLSKPFQQNLKEGQLFQRERAAAQLLQVIDNARPDQSGSLLAWDGQEISP